MNFIKCDKIIKNINYSSSIIICQQLKKCEKINFNNIIYSTSYTNNLPGGSYIYFNTTSVLSFSTKCYEINPFSGILMGISLLKDNKKLKIIYDSNSFDRNNCYKPIDNKGIYNLTTIWEVKFDSSDWELAKSEEWEQLTRNNNIPYCSNMEKGNRQFYGNFMIVESKKYRYYISPNGIWKKFKMGKIINVITKSTKDEYRGDYMSGSGAINIYNNYFMNDTRYNNATLLYSENNMYSVKYIVEDANIIYNGTTIQICNITDIDIKKIYSF